ncbi:PREDICTED: pickpocket protein 28 [Dinoponera quadriceps]|uniref:Pickpocket protein 28 n=1 Tax=Dinoponera quadriceps TaxID=609295 RepID=A0A6P3Y5Z5_DINQU|nr:PREDICTED: pickpocket protein 28 [Dinoponera quadriceps]
MKSHGDKKARLEDLKRGYYRCLTLNVKKYLNGWFYVYCKNTSLHGFRYITVDGSTVFESTLWSMVCVSAITFCVVLMLRLWANYSRNPIATTIDTSNLIWDLPFPAVTVCNNNKIYRPHADIIAKQLWMNGITLNETERFFSSLLRLVRPNKVLIDNTTAKNILEILGMTVDMLMNKLMQPCSALLVKCAWLGQLYDCDKIFKKVKSKEGFCCAFNFHHGLKHRYDDDELDQPEVHENSTDFNVTFEYQPGVRRILKAPGSGRDMGLAVALNIDRYNYKGSVRPYVGASILIHDPIDFPDIGAQIASVPPSHVLAISVSGTSIKSMDNMRDLPREKRLCLFDNEIPGEGHYSFQSCVSDCIAKSYQTQCGCLPFYYPETHIGVRTCYLTDVDCILARRGKSLSGEDRASKKTCKGCLPQCSDIMYSIDAEGVKMDVNVGYESELTHGLDLDNISIVYVFFGDISYVEYRKESILSWDGLLASFGGIFGLCLGGSVMSVIELVYLLVREFFKVRKSQTEQSRGKSLPPAAEVFLSIPTEKIQLQKPRNYRDAVDKRVDVSWYQPSLQRHKRMDFDDAYNKRVKF